MEGDSLPPILLCTCTINDVIKGRQLCPHNSFPPSAIPQKREVSMEAISLLKFWLSIEMLTNSYIVNILFISN